MPEKIDIVTKPKCTCPFCQRCERLSALIAAKDANALGEFAIELLDMECELLGSRDEEIETLRKLLRKYTYCGSDYVGTGSPGQTMEKPRYYKDVEAALHLDGRGE